MTADRIIRWSTAGAVVGVAAVAAVASYEYAYDLVRAHGEVGWTARLVPLTVDGLIYASSMVMLDSVRRKAPVPGLARWMLGLGIAATLAANVAHGLGHGLIGAAVAAWPAVALVGSYELLMMIIRGAQSPTAEANASEAESGRGPEEDPLQVRATGEFADQIASGTVPSIRAIRAIRARLHVGQPRAQQVRKYLAARQSGKQRHETTTRVPMGMSPLLASDSMIWDRRPAVPGTAGLFGLLQAKDVVDVDRVEVFAAADDLAVLDVEEVVVARQVVTPVLHGQASGDHLRRPYLPHYAERRRPIRGMGSSL